MWLNIGFAHIKGKAAMQAGLIFRALPAMCRAELLSVIGFYNNFSKTRI